MAEQNDISKQHNTETFPFLMDHLPDFFRKKAEKELNETPENKVDMLKEMKEIIKTDNILKDAKYEEDFLNQFLRHSKYNVRRAITRLQKFVAFRRNYESYFHPVSKEYFSRKGFTALPMRSPDGCTILLAEYGYWDPEQMSIDDVGRIGFMISQQSLRDPMAQINGFIFICDMKDVSFKIVRQFTPYYIHFFYQLYLNCLPGRFKEVHIVNEPVTFKMIWTVLKTFLPEKLKRRIFFHSSPERLLEYLPRSVLPSQYGGDLKDYYMTDWMIKAGEQLGKCPMGGQANYY